MLFVLKIADEGVFLQFVGVGGENLEQHGVGEDVVAVGGCGQHLARDVRRKAEQLSTQPPHVGGSGVADVGHLRGSASTVDAALIELQETGVGRIG